MRSITSTAFDIVNGLGEAINTLQYDPSTGLYKTPYTEVKVESYSKTEEPLSMFRAEDIAFVNTAEFSRAAQTYTKTGKYTNAHPKYDAKEYNAFWDEEERRCRDGYSLPGKLIKLEDGSYRLQEVHITGQHYGYLNYSEIKLSKGMEKSGGAIHSPAGEILTKTGGSSKEFFFPSFWDGDYYFFKAVELCRQIGKHLVVGKARRKGYSYKNGWLVADRYNFYRRSSSVVGAYDAASLFEDGTMNKVENYLNFINKHTAWSKRRLHNTLEHFESGFRYVGDPTKHGYLSNIWTAVLKGNPGGMRGKDADLLLLEEAGKCPNLSEILDATLKTLSDGIYTTGLFIAFGTGGGDDNQWQGFEDLFYSPHARKFIAFENIWDKDMLGTACGYFHGSHMTKPGLIDVHGNSDVAKSREFSKQEKALLAHDPSKLSAYEMEEPESPSEAFCRAVNPIFQAKELDEQLRRVERDPILQGIGREGIFVQGANDKVVFLDRKFALPEEQSLIPPYIVNYPTKPTDDLRGCWVLWEQPYIDPVTGQIPEDLYSIWNDPFAISKDKDYYSIKDSLGSSFLYEHPNNFTSTKGDRIIGEFVGRREDTSDYDLQMFLCALYFRAKILYENDRGDVFSNAKSLGLLDLLKTEPEFQYQKELSKGGNGRKRGISIATNVARKMNGVLYAKKWMGTERGIDKNGHKVLNLNYIYSIAFLKELLKYDGKRNADRVSTLIIGMYDIREALYKGIQPVSSAQTVLTDTYFDSPFNE